MTRDRNLPLPKVQKVVAFPLDKLSLSITIGCLNLLLRHPPNTIKLNLTFYRISIGFSKVASFFQQLL